MATNLRGRPIEGYITDSAGSILRNTTVTIQESTPIRHGGGGLVVVDTVSSDDDGYFVSKPLKNGLYDIYEGGVRIYREYHSANPTIIQCYRPDEYSIPSNIRPFSDYVSGTSPIYDINEYRYYLQIETDDDLLQPGPPVYGHTFPIWGINVPTGLVGLPFEKIANVHVGLSTASESRLTTSRFDVEFSLDNRYMRWAGVPGILFYKDSRIVVPLDYYSLVPTRNKKSLAISTTPTITSNMMISNATVYDEAAIGDIFEISFDGYSNIAWGIVYYKSGSNVYLKPWNSSNNSMISQGTPDFSYFSGFTTESITIYSGFYDGMENLDSSTGERFTVQENQYAQNLWSAPTELYNYNEA